MALRQAGFAVELHEAAPALGEVGAGLTLSRGAQQVFRYLGLQSAIARHATPSTAFPFVHYRTGRLLAGAVNLGRGAPDDGTADVSRQCHRADLHAELAAAWGEVRLGHSLTEIEDSKSGVRATFADGSHAEGDALIAADGVRSAARAILFGEDEPRFTGQVAYRFLVDGERARPFLDHGRGAVFIGPARTFNRYTLRGGGLLNCVGIAATEQWTGDGWATPASIAELSEAFDGWHPQVTGLFGEANNLIKWGIFDRVPLPRWSEGRTTLLGDAAHAMTPFLGMGAAMAIEDAMILARAFEAEQAVAPAFARYEAARRPRTLMLQEKSAEQGRLTQARDPDHYDPAAAPASDASILAYDPVRAEI